MADMIAPHRSKDDAKMPRHLRLAIERKHEHEGEGNTPIWLVYAQYLWANGTSDPPALDTVCDSLRSAYYHVYMILDEDQRGQICGDLKVRKVCHVERIPANHRFASSIQDQVANAERKHRYR